MAGRGRDAVVLDEPAAAGIPHVTVSSPGLTSGIDLALRVVERYLGRAAAVGTARYMEHESTRWRTA